MVNIVLSTSCSSKTAKSSKCIGVKSWLISSQNSFVFVAWAGPIGSLFGAIFLSICADAEPEITIFLELISGLRWVRAVELLWGKSWGGYSFKQTFRGIKKNKRKNDSRLKFNNKSKTYRKTSIFSALKNTTCSIFLNVYISKSSVKSHVKEYLKRKTKPGDKNLFREKEEQSKK